MTKTEIITMAASRNSIGGWERLEERPVGESGATDQDAPDGERPRAPDAVPLIAPGAGDDGSVRFVDERARRADEMVPITRTAAEAAALRAGGLLAVAHRENGGSWDAACEVTEERGVEFVAVEPHSGSDRFEPDARAIGLIGRRVGVLVPRNCWAWQRRTRLSSENYEKMPREPRKQGRNAITRNYKKFRKMRNCSTDPGW